MGDYPVKHDKTRAVQFLTNERGIPVLIYGDQAMAVFQDADFAKLMRMAQTIREKRPKYTDEDAIEWATTRAVEAGNLVGGVVRIGREHV